MPIKPPTGGSTPVKVDASTSPTRPAEVNIPLPGLSGRRGTGAGHFPDLLPRAGSSSAIDADAIRMTPAVVIHVSPGGVRLPAPQSSLDRYLIGARAMLPEINDEGLRVFNGIPFADVAGGDFVAVALDPKTGLYRARLTSELLLGPVILRDAGSGLWYERQVVEPTTRAQVRRYLPETTDLDADAFITKFADKDVAELELERIQQGLPQFDSKHISIPHHQNHVAQSHEVTEVFAMWGTLSQLYKWQSQPDQRVYSDGRLSGFKLDINLTLWPVDKLLSLKFNSVVSLTLRGQAPLDPEVFFAQFPNIESLTITSQIVTRRTFGDPANELAYSRFNMDSRFTEQLKRLSRLRELNLQDCDLQADFSVRGITRLQVLRLGSTQGAAVNDLAGPLRFQVPVEHQNDFLRTDPDISGMTELRVLDLTGAGLRRIPFGLDADNGPLRLEVLKLRHNRLSVAPSVKRMTALQELDLANTGLDRFPEGITNEIPGKVLNLTNNRITSIPESIELRVGFKLSGNPVTDPSSLRRLIHARMETGTDIWLGEPSTDRSANLWLRNVPPGKELTDKLKLWDSFGTDSRLLDAIRQLSRTPEFHVEYLLLQRRVWSFLEIYSKRGPGEQARLDNILFTEQSPGKMLDRLENEIREHDSGRQNPPLHHLPKRPRFDP